MTDRSGVKARSSVETLQFRLYHVRILVLGTWMPETIVESPKPSGLGLKHEDVINANRTPPLRSLSSEAAQLRACP